MWSIFNSNGELRSYICGETFVAEFEQGCFSACTSGSPFAAPRPFPWQSRGFRAGGSGRRRQESHWQAQWERCKKRRKTWTRWKRERLHRIRAQEAKDKCRQFQRNRRHSRGLVVRLPRFGEGRGGK